MNKCIFTGRFTSAPRRQDTENNKRCFFTIMVNSIAKKADGTKYPAQAVDFVAWGKTAELICQTKDKGHLVLIESDYSTYERDAVDFNNQPIPNARKYQRPIFTVRTIEFLSNPGDKSNTGNTASQAQNNNNTTANSGINPSDIPSYNAEEFGTSTPVDDNSLPFDIDSNDDPFALNEL